MDALDWDTTTLANVENRLWTTLRRFRARRRTRNGL